MNQGPPPEIATAKENTAQRGVLRENLGTREPSRQLFTPLSPQTVLASVRQRHSPATASAICHATSAASELPPTDSEVEHTSADPPLSLSFLTSHHRWRSSEETRSSSNEMVWMCNEDTSTTQPEQNKHDGENSDMNKKKMCATGPDSPIQLEKSTPASSSVGLVVMPALKNRQIEHTPDQESQPDSSERRTSTGTVARKRAPQPKKPGQTAGRWTDEEHQAFLEGLKVFGREWKKVASRIPTRTSAQIRSHAQKYFSKLDREESVYLQEQHHFHPQNQPVAPSFGGMHTHHPSVPLAPAVAPIPGVSTSVRRNMNRIIANPEAAQLEVEDTLRQLRERYRQLQVRLDASSGQRHRRQRAPMLGIDESDSQHLGPSHPQSHMDQRKRTFDEAMYDVANADELSSVSSSVSASSVAMSPTREELIALHVLGGDLPRSLSNQELPPLGHSESNDVGASNEEAPAPPSGQEPEHDQMMP